MEIQNTSVFYQCVDGFEAIGENRSIKCKKMSIQENLKDGRTNNYDADCESQRVQRKTGKEA